MYDIKKQRKLKGLTQKQLAEKLQVHQTAVSQWEKGITQPRSAILPALLSVFDCKIEDIYVERGGAGD